MSQPRSAHVPVMLAEIVQWLDPQPGQIIVDGTLGGGGHTRALAQRAGTAGRLISLDLDPAALTAAEVALAGQCVTLVHSNYAELPAVLEQLQVPAVDGIVLDLGLSSDQLADADRGFSFNAPGPLDLRFDPDSGEPAWRLLERLTEKQLADVIYRYGEERYSRRIAREIVARRRQAPVRRSEVLADLVRRCIPTRGHGERIDPATRTFQALRIAVNDELKSLETALRDFPDCLRPGGRMAIITFHSLEDRAVKEAFRQDPRYEVLTKKPLRPSDAEVESNPRARSAKLRVAARRH